jgi:hypothetical protein
VAVNQLSQISIQNVKKLPFCIFQLILPGLNHAHEQLVAGRYKIAIDRAHICQSAVELILSEDGDCIFVVEGFGFEVGDHLVDEFHVVLAGSVGLFLTEVL